MDIDICTIAEKQNAANAIKNARTFLLRRVARFRLCKKDNSFTPAFPFFIFVCLRSYIKSNAGLFNFKNAYNTENTVKAIAGTITNNSNSETWKRKGISGNSPSAF